MSDTEDNETSTETTETSSHTEPGTYATLCIDYHGNEVVELLTSFATLQRIDPGATVHVLVNSECKTMIERSPFNFITRTNTEEPEEKRDNNSQLTIVFDLSIDEYLRLTDVELNEREMVVDYYSQLFSFLRRILDGQKKTGAETKGLLYFMAGCWFLRPVRVNAMAEHANDSFVGVGESESGAIGDLFFVRNVPFIDDWQKHVMGLADARYEADISNIIVTKRKEYKQIQREERKRKAQEKTEETQETQKTEEKTEETQETQKTEETEEMIEIPEDFDEQIKKAYRIYVSVDTIKRKFSYVGQIGGSHSVNYFSNATYINPMLFFRANNELAFDKLDADATGVVYKGDPVCVMRKLPAQKNGGEYLNGPIHKIISLFANAHPLNQHLLTLASGNKIVFQRAYDKDFCGYKHESRFQAELFEMMEMKNAAYVRSQYLLYPCDSVGGQVQVYPGDDDSGLLLPYLSGRVHTLIHFEPSAETKTAFAKYNPNGWSKHLKCAERPLLLHQSLIVEQEQEEEKSTQSEKNWHEMTRDEILNHVREQALYDPVHDGRKLTRPKETNQTESNDKEQTEDTEDDGTEAYKEHIKRLLSSRFAVVRPDPDAPGVCHQFSEAMACGAIPVLDDGPDALPTDVTGFEYPIESGVHYVESTDALIRLGLGAETEMRKACVDYYTAHCSPEGFFRTLMSKYWGIQNAPASQ